jgi:hypothetical protein
MRMKEIKENAIYFKEDVIDLLSIEKEDGTIIRPETTVNNLFANKNFPKCDFTKSHFITGKTLLDYLSNWRNWR